MRNDPEKKSQVGIGDIHLELPAVNLELCSEMVDFRKVYTKAVKASDGRSLASNLESNR